MRLNFASYLGSVPEAWIMGVRGYDFDDFGEGLSEPAAENLEEAVAFLETAVREDDFEEMDPSSLASATLLVL